LYGELWPEGVNRAQRANAKFRFEKGVSMIELNLISEGMKEVSMKKFAEFVIIDFEVSYDQAISALST
jgi:hypothetical protein